MMACRRLNIQRTCFSLTNLLPLDKAEILGDGLDERAHHGFSARSGTKTRMWTFTNQITSSKPARDFFDHFYISLRHRYAFHTVGKAANSTVKLLLYKEELAGTKIKIPSVHTRSESPLLSPYQLSDVDMDWIMKGDEFTRFTFVRNPYSRLLSCYLDRIAHQESRPYRELMRAMGKEVGYRPSFAEFILTICAQRPFEQNNHWRVQYDDALCEHIEYHEIGKQEEFTQDFARIYKRIFRRDIPFGATKANASPSATSAASKLEEYWTDELSQIVAERYSKDFSFFNYPVERVF